MSISSQLVQTKINSGGIQQFGASMSTLYPELSPCGSRYGFDQYGRPAPPDSVDSLTCPGLFSASVIIDNENSLRSFLSPRYYDLPVGLSGGTDTLFGQGGGRAQIAGYAPQKTYEISDFTANNKNIQGQSSEQVFASLGQNYGSTYKLPAKQYSFE